MKLKKLKGWKKGATLGFLIGLAIGIIWIIGLLIVGIVITDKAYKFGWNTIFETILLIFVIILFLTLIGIFIGFLSSLVRNNLKDNYPLNFGFIGLIVGLLLSILLLTPYAHNLKWLTKPIFNLHYLVTGCKYDCYDLIFIYPITFILIFSLIGIIIGFILGKLRK